MASAEELSTTRIGSFKYLAATAEPSLFRNGKVLTRRNREGSDSEWVGVDLEPHDMAVHDARALAGAARPTVERNGFELLTRPLPPGGIDFRDHAQVLRDYYPHCEAIVREATGAAIVRAFDHNLRSAGGKKAKERIAGGQEVQGPAHVVHGDYTLTSAPQRLRDLARPPKENDTVRGVLAEGETLLDADRVERAIESGRFAIINVWRNIAEEPVATNPLALCDAERVDPEDLVVFEIHYSDRIGENYFAKPSARHGWYFYPAMTGDEALLIKQWDSSGHLARTRGAEPDSAAPGEPCTFSFHSAFQDPATPPDAPDRRSIEVRCVVLYD
ncbi:CmcJ/NvfI family oxidoreductase [Marinibaculum pumilum]|uniref:CmcJ/NvfI family oxidoreductase n=1 Tax=Marinibaculum pumilum TaxID=1766165 RepID=A0ABV7KZW4_9PROT